MVLPWYAPETPGGAESLGAQLAFRLADVGVAVDLLTTTIRRFASEWGENYHRSGINKLLEGVRLFRFSVQPRNTAEFVRLNGRLLETGKLVPEEEAAFWTQMIRCPDLEKYLAEHHREYEAVVFLPYLFSTTVQGMEICGDRGVLVPCLHDEPYARLSRVRKMFLSARRVIYLSEPEKQLAGRLYGRLPGMERVLGAGLDEVPLPNPERFRRRYRLTQPYLLYVGRQDAGKNVHQLIHFFDRYLWERPGLPLQLVLAGPGRMDLPRRLHRQVLRTGVLSEEAKREAMAGALVFCQPSVNESFSIVLMESWLVRRPALVNGRCRVTAHFVRAADGGLYYRDYFEFAACLDWFLSHPHEAQQMGRQGCTFVRKNFLWPRLVNEYRKFLCAGGRTNG